jgi:hypothetical protein
MKLSSRMRNLSCLFWTVSVGELKLLLVMHDIVLPRSSPSRAWWCHCRRLCLIHVHARGRGERCKFLLFNQKKQDDDEQTLLCLPSSGLVESLLSATMSLLCAWRPSVK